MPLVQKSCGVCGNTFFSAKRDRNCARCRSLAVMRSHDRRERREFDARGSYTKEEWQLKLIEYKHCCYWCDRYLWNQAGRFIGTRDHLTPLVRGGSNEIANIVPACRRCNSRKGTRTAEEYEALISKTSTVPASSLPANLPEQLTFEPWPEPSRQLAQVIARLAASKQMEESILPFLGIDLFAKKPRIEARKQVLREQAQELTRRRA